MKKQITFISMLLLFLVCRLSAQDKPVRVLAAPVLDGPYASSGFWQEATLPAMIPYDFDMSTSGMVRLMVLPNTNAYLNVEMDVQVLVQVNVYDQSMNVVHSAQYPLNISYMPFQNAPYKDQDYIVFNGTAFPQVYKIRTTIQSITVNGMSASLPDNMRIETSIDYLRYHQFSTQPNTPPSIEFNDFDCDGQPDYVQISWQPVAGATYYDLEWSSLNDYDASALSAIRTIPSAGYDFDFRHNSTRVVTANTTYTIPNIFDRGQLTARVRAHGRQNYLNNAEVAGEWTSPCQAVSAPQFQDQLSWQYNASFAEEGKQKTVVNYADGSGRSRQTITQNNSDHVTIVGQTIYDFTGRPAVTVLPAPLPTPQCGSNAQNSYIYRPNLSMTSSLGPFSKYHFEMDLSPGNCSSLIGFPMDSVSGAALYYSASNSEKSGQQAYVPAALGFPFSRIEYTGDNTGRISKQGGVGREFQVGLNHETKYMYGVPEQIELDRLFGSEAGDASHYHKNLSIDPNGQVSVTYQDMAGKTVATALAGNAPAGLDNIAPTIGVSSLTSDMFNKDANGKSELNAVSPDCTSISFKKSILVSGMNSSNTFNYDVTIDTLKLPCVPNLCFSCVYDFEFTVSDDCGQLFPSPALNGKRMIGHFTMNGADTVFTLDCSTPNYTYPYPGATPNLASTQLVLNPGVYYVTKTLKINEEARAAYLQAYLNPANNTGGTGCLPNIDQIQADELQKLSSTDCSTITCQSCLDKLGTKDNYVAKGKGTEQEWEVLHDQCKAICKISKTSCEIALDQLLADVSPNGQYGNCSNPTDLLSVFNSQNLLPKNVNTSNVLPGTITPNATAYWKKPVHISGAQHYFDQNGQIAMVQLSKLPLGTTANPGNFNLAVDNVSQVYSTGPNVYYTAPENLTNLADFVAKWQASWAKSLVTYHPEYCYYKDCIDVFDAIAPGSTISSNDFDAQVIAASTFQAALSANLLTVQSGGGYGFNLNSDPANAPGYFLGSAYLAGSTPLADKYVFYDLSMSALSMHQYVAYMVKCQGQYGVNQTANPSCMTFCASSDSPTLKDNQWNMLKSLYLAAKADIKSKFSDARRFSTPSSCSYYNGCIGNAAFNAYTSPMVNYPNISTSPYFHPDQPCNMNMKDLYAAKTRRFGMVNTLPDPDPDAAAYQTYLQTGQCPNAFDLQNLADALAKNSMLTAASENLQNYPAFTLNLYNLLNNLPTPPTNYVSYSWQSTINGSNDLLVNIKNASTGSLTSITFHPPTAGINWSQVTRITQLSFTSIVGGLYSFTCTAKVQSGTTITYVAISGQTQIKLDDCMFKDVCKPNDLALDIQSLFTSLAASGNLLNSTGIDLGGPGEATLYGNSLQKVKQLIAPAVASPNFNFVKTSNYSFSIYEVNSPQCAIVINFINIDPGSLSGLPWSSVTGFTNIKSDYQNFFTMEARNSAGSLLGTIKAEIFKQCSGNTSGLSMGTCAKPDPIECQTQFNQNEKDLEALLTDIIVNKKYATGANNVMNNPNLSSNLTSGFPQLASNIPAIKYTISDPYYQTLNQLYVPQNPALTNDSVAFTFKTECQTGGNPSGKTIGDGGQQTSSADQQGCTEVDYCTIWFKTNHKSPTSYGNLSNVSSVVKLVGYGNTTPSGAYTNFYIVVTYPANGNIETPKDTLWGSSCFEIKNCDACGTNPVSTCCENPPTGQQRSMGSGDIYSSLKNSFDIARGYAIADSSAVMYSRYKDAIFELSSRMISPITPMGIAPIMNELYPDVEPYFLNFIRHFETGKNNAAYLTDVWAYMSSDPFFTSPEYAFVVYNNAVQSYNARAAILSVPEMLPVDKDAFNSGNYNSYINNYASYLRHYEPSVIRPPRNIGEYDPSSGFKQYAGEMTTQSDDNDCHRNFLNLVSTINNFNNSTFALDNNHSLELPLSEQALVTYNYCPCMLSYMNYINGFSILPRSIKGNKPVVITDFAGCGNKSFCEKQYDTYAAATAAYNQYKDQSGSDLPNLPVIYTSEMFTKDGYCYCADKYSAFLNGIVDGSITDINYINSHIDIAGYCNPTQVSCAKPAPVSDDPPSSPAYTPTSDPCMKYKQDLAKANAKLVYDKAIKDQTEYFIKSYNAKCLSPVENLTRIYDDREFQYTLYYYDQAGNLIKTIPPEGIDKAFYNSIKHSYDPNELLVRHDRTSHAKTVMVNHTLASNYVYNSLNQLIKQKIPDHDGVNSDVFQYDYCTGADTLLNIVSSQVIDQSTGYMAGNQNVPNLYVNGGLTRGKLFASYDGCSSWTPVGNTVGTDLKKIEMIAVSSALSYGFAVGSNGTFMMSADNGSTWDQYPISQYTGTNILNDLKAMRLSSGYMETVMVGDNGTVVKAAMPLNGLPTISIWNQGLPQDKVTDITGILAANGTSFDYYITVLHEADQSSRIYVRNSASSGNWADISGTNVLDLAKVRYINGTSHYYAAGKDGTLIKSTNPLSVAATDQWYLKSTGTAQNFRDVYFANDNAGVAIMEQQGATGSVGSLYKTLDGGNSWTIMDQADLTGNPPVKNYQSFNPFSSSGGVDMIVAGSTGGIVKRITLNCSNPANPAIGGVGSTLANSSLKITDVCVIPYAGGSKLFAMAGSASGDIYYCDDYGQSSVSWVYALNAGTGVNVKKILFTIDNPLAPSFVLSAAILDANGAPHCFVSNAYTPGPSQTAVWNPVMPVSMPTGNSYYDMVHDFSDPSAIFRVYLIGKNISGAADFSYFTLGPWVSGGAALSAYGTSGTAPGVTFRSMAINTGNSHIMAAGDNGVLYSITNSLPNIGGSNTYHDQTGSIVPSRINDIKFDGSNLTVMGNDGFYAKKAGPSFPFGMIATGLSAKFNAFDFYTSNTTGAPPNLMAVCDNGLVWDRSSLTGIANTYTPTIENLNDFAWTSPILTPLVKNAYFVGDHGTAIHADLSTSTYIFASLSLSTEDAMQSVAVDPNGQMILSGGDNTTAFQLGAITAIRNSNWFTNEITRLHFTNANNGYFVGKKGLIRHTTDGGLTWSAVAPYYDPGSNLPYDYYSVYTTDVDKAIVGSNYAGISNVDNLALAPPVQMAGNIGFIVTDIDLGNENTGFAVAAYASLGAATRLNIIDNAVAGLTNLTPSYQGDMFTSLYAFKGDQLGKFLVAGQGGSLRYFNGTSFNPISITAGPNTSFPTGQGINALDFADNTDGYMGTISGKLYALTMNHAAPSVIVTQKNAAPGNTTANKSINTISIIDNGAISGFMGGNVSSSYKYNWRFSEAKGKYSDLFWYDRLGRLVVSQNAKQSPDKYSYTRYDALDRIIEVGQKQENTTANTFTTIFGAQVNNALSAATIDDGKLQTWLNDEGARTEVTHTYYDQVPFLPAAIATTPLANFPQLNLRKRVACVTYKPVDDGNLYNYDYATHYSYDIAGNVQAIAQDNQKLSLSPYYVGGVHFSVISYEYDQISGKVNNVHYKGLRPGDEFHHEYSYDADNRITEVRTSRDGQVWESDAKYFYYKHGPLARTELGHDKLQGMDYAYTLQGWLKGVNSNQLDPNTDIGHDADPNGVNNLFPLDAMGFTLGYYKDMTEDYQPIDPTVWSASQRFEAVQANSSTTSQLMSARKNLFNGNISYMATSLCSPAAPYNDAPPPSNFVLDVAPLANAYNYDQLNRITKSNSFNDFKTGGNSWFDPKPTGYRNSFTYDGNGNILTQQKYDANNSLVDAMTYNYNLDGNHNLVNNRLHDVGSTQAPELYGYDAIGNLVNNSGMDVLNNGIVWSVYGKIKEVNRMYYSDKKNLKFDYDPQGNRVAKHVYDVNNNYEKSTYYVHDAQGNVMAVYESSLVSQSYPIPPLMYFTLKERPIYGSSRLGMDRHEEDLGYNTFGQPVPSPLTGDRQVGKKHFEMSNHLGNINAVISDIKVPVNYGSYYVPDIVSATDYYPFGSPMPGRSHVSGAYRYGFNGKEKDDEVNGSDTDLDFGDRIYNSGLGRWLSLDPLQKKYPGLSPYNFTFNNPITFKDADGRDGVLSVVKNENGGGTITLETTIRIYGASASDQLAKDLTKESAALGTSKSFKSKTGEIWTVNIKTTYIYNKSIESAQKVMNSAPDHITQADELTEGEKASANFKPGDNIMKIDYKVNLDEAAAGLSGIGSNGGIIGKGANNTTVFHESGHLIGFKDRYENRDLGHWRMSANDPVFEGDPMTTTSGATNLNLIHFYDVYSEGLQQLKANGGQSFQGKVINKGLDKGTGQTSQERYDKAKSKEVKNQKK